MLYNSLSLLDSANTHHCVTAGGALRLIIPALETTRDDIGYATELTESIPVYSATTSPARVRSRQSSSTQLPRHCGLQKAVFLAVVYVHVRERCRCLFTDERAHLFELMLERRRCASELRMCQGVRVYTMMADNGALMLLCRSWLFYSLLRCRVVLSFWEHSGDALESGKATAQDTTTARKAEVCEP